MASYNYFVSNDKFNYFKTFNQLHCDNDFIKNISLDLKPDDEIIIINNSDIKEKLKYIFVYKTLDGGLIRKINEPSKIEKFLNFLNKLWGQR